MYPDDYFRRRRLRLDREPEPAEFRLTVDVLVASLILAIALVAAVLLLGRPL